MNSNKPVAFQGTVGAYSHQACKEVFPTLGIISCSTFEDVLEKVKCGQAQYAMIPVDNSLYGRIADVYHLLPEADLQIVAEHFLQVRLNLLGHPGTRLDQIQRAASHSAALGQCRSFLRQHGIQPRIASDTAGAAWVISETQSPDTAAIASHLAAEVYNLEILAEDIQDADHNTTRFLVLAQEPGKPGGAPVITSLCYAVRNVPASLYKTLGGFATNGVNIVKLESYMVNGSFTATEFHLDIEGSPEDPMVKLSLEELDFFTDQLKILGVYPAHPYRKTYQQRAQFSDDDSDQTQGERQ